MSAMRAAAVAAVAIANVDQSLLDEIVCPEAVRLVKTTMEAKGAPAALAR